MQNQLMRIWLHLLVDFPSPTQPKKYLVFELLCLYPGEVGSILVVVFQPIRLWTHHLSFLHFFFKCEKGDSCSHLLINVTFSKYWSYRFKKL